MRRSAIGFRAFGCAAAAILLSSCGSNSFAPGAAERSAGTDRIGPAYRVLYSFGGSATDGKVPEARLVNVDGTLYGTTTGGGSGCYSSGGCGTVFAITPSGAENVLYSFTGSADGASPETALTNANGLLYGTTSGGASSNGTVFSVTPSGSEKVLHRFHSGSDGSLPEAPLVDVRGTLFGTTAFGGSPQNRGTVYQLTTSGSEKVLYKFLGSHRRHRDGKYPKSGLLDVMGDLYGTTYEGGKYNRGTVFKITSAGVETVVHNFKGTKSDGAYPHSNLLYVDGKIYGTTSGGGNGRCEGCGHHEHFGTVFVITLAGNERLIYKFKGYPNDGAVPNELTYHDGIFYGTTVSGGANCAVDHGCGTIFSITPSGSERMLYSFLPADGAEPASGVVVLDRKLYGTTPTGGAYDYGTVYSLSP